MNSFVVVLCMAVAASASGLGWGVGHGHHIPSGSIGVSHDGVVIAGPSGSIHTDNGLHGHGAGARLSGPAGEVGTHGGHAHLAGPGIGHHGLGYAAVAPIAVGHWGHGGLAHGLVGGWAHHGGAVLSHGLVGYGHHGW